MATKPAFDPSQPFQAVPEATQAAAKPAFDPSKPFDAVPETPAEEPSFLEKHADGLKKAKELLGQEAQGWDLGTGPIMGGLEQAGLNAAYPIVRGISKLTGNPLPEQSPVQNAQALQAQGAKGDIGPTSASKIYRQGVTETQKDLDADQADLGTGASLGANLVGALSPGGPLGLISGGVHSALGVEKTALAAAKAEGGYAGLAKELAKRGAVDAAAMAPIGGIQSAAESKGGLIGTDDDQKMQELKDTAKGAATGGLIAAGTHALPLLSQAASDAFSSLTPDAIANSPILKAYQMGSQGVDNSSLKQAAPKAAESIVDMFNNAKNMIGKQMGSALDDAHANGQLINIEPQLADAGQDVVQAVNSNPLFANKYGKNISSIFEPGRVEVTPMELKQTIADTDSMLGQLSKATDPASIQSRQILGQFQNGIKDALKEQVPAYQVASDRYGNFMNNTIQTIRRGDVPQDMLKNGFKAPAQSVQFKKTLDTINGSAGQSNVLDNLQQGLGNVQDTEADLIKNGKMSPDQSVFSQLKSPDDVMNQFKDAQSQAGLSNTLNGGYTLPISAKGVNLTGFVKDNATKLANDAGKATSWVKGAASSIVSKPVALGNKLYQASDDQLTGVIGRIRQSNPDSLVADSLESALKNGDSVRKNAAIFSIMQNPNMRSMLNGDNDGSGEGNR